jgi:anti-sigma factor RsiW
MEHAEARELLEIAAVEPHGFERLAAGDTLEAAALAGHLAGCPECAEEMERLRRASAVVRDVVRTLPPADLRERTLAFVAAVGRQPEPAAGASAASPESRGVPANVRAEATSAPVARRPATSSPRLGFWVASIAAAVAIALLGTSILVGRDREATIAAQAEDIDSLAKVAIWTVRIDGLPDAQHVELAGTGTAGSGASGTLVFSPTSKEVVILARGLPEPAAGLEYRCWMEIGGGRTKVGRMFLGGGVAYWVGNVEAVSKAVPGTPFGVSLVEAGGDSVSGDPILAGEL